MAAGRHSIGFELDEVLRPVIHATAQDIVAFSNQQISQRLERHRAFVQQRTDAQKLPKHTHEGYGFPVISSQEQALRLNELERVQTVGDGVFEVAYKKPGQAEPSHYPGSASIPPEGPKTPITCPNLTLFPWSLS